MLVSRSKIFFWALIICLTITAIASILIFRPVIDGDGPTYVLAIKVLQGVARPLNFVPNRLITTFLGLESIILFSKIFGSFEVGWLILNILFYFLLNITFYKLVQLIFASDRTAFVATLFLATNYAMISFGLDYWLDIGGWLFYVLSLYLTLAYSQTSERKFLLLSALAIGLGGLFKENAFLGVIPIAVILIYEQWPSLIQIVKKALIPALLAIIPIATMSWIVYSKFNYTYVSWLTTNQEHYVYSSRIVEYVKSFGSLYNILAFLILGGLYCYCRYFQELVPETKTRVFILAVILSILPIFVWPAITQRILFITVPASLIVTSFWFKKYEQYWYLFLPLLIAYLVANFLMNSIILPNFNLPF